MADTPRIYVASLSDYNAGVLHGCWIDAADADTIQEEVAAMLRESAHPNTTCDCPDCDGEGCDECNDTGEVPTAEEWAIHDSEGFGPLTISEHESFEDVAAYAAGIEEHGEAWAAYVDHQGGLEYADGFEDDYCGEYGSEQDYAEQLIDDCYNLDEMMGSLAYYFDYEKFSHDLFIGDNYSIDAPGGNVWVFRRS